MSYILILGAKSDVAKALAKEYAELGYNLYLMSRKVSDLELFANDLKIRSGKEVLLKELDILKWENHAEIYNNLEPKPIGLISLIGLLGDQKIAENDFNHALRIMNTNFVAITSFLEIAANDMKEKKNGFIVGVSSVAGDRGRASNYYYGAAKSGFSTFLSGLRNRLNPFGVKVLTVKPGFMKTKMTEDLELPSFLTISAEKAAHLIVKAQKKGRDVVYIFWVWRWIMMLIGNIPEFLFKKMKL
ncbi:MAG: SDR family oxidoreductase [Cyclobacteriaceae bacterium]|nr:SDR family oxidoreductase [Cyclobacteriaceae bacterium HetDA_MAG_MS6]